MFGLTVRNRVTVEQVTPLAKLSLVQFSSSPCPTASHRTAVSHREGESVSPQPPRGGRDTDCRSGEPPHSLRLTLAHCLPPLCRVTHTQTLQIELANTWHISASLCITHEPSIIIAKGLYSVCSHKLLCVFLHHVQSGYKGHVYAYYSPAFQLIHERYGKVDI